MSSIIKTEFGNAKINHLGYYVITSYKEGNHNKLLHRLIFEKEHKCTLFSHAVVHHKNGIKIDNNLDNLKLMLNKNHVSMHNKNKIVSDETKRKISENHADVKGKNNPYYGMCGEKHHMYGKKGKDTPRYKDYARIIKKGNCNGKQRYAIRFDGKNIKHSVNVTLLHNWFLENYPMEIIKKHECVI